MAKINLLDSQIYNRIAAGEVVENPKSVVKELVENCIDAGATSITVDICGGGIELIKVTDNGAGMSKDDLEKSILPHATSKVGSLSDLNHISTLGFRGEALPSIASVSRLKITSREQGCELGNYIEYSFGEYSGSGDCGAPEGTTVLVESLFEKIPARKKFLKKPSLEAAEVTNLMLRYVISNYNIAIKYVLDGKIIFHSDGKGLQSALYTAYGKDFFDNLVFVENTMNDIAIYGFVGKPGYCRHNRSYQTLVVNGRYVTNSDITYLVQNCYKDYLMTRQFPVWVIFIELPDDMVDVNVHPNKMDIKFADFSKVKKQLYSTILDVVKSLSGMPDVLLGALNDRAEKSLFNDSFSLRSPIFDYKSSFGASEAYSTANNSSLPNASDAINAHFASETNAANASYFASETNAANASYMANETNAVNAPEDGLVINGSLSGINGVLSSAGLSGQGECREFEFQSFEEGDAEKDLLRLKNAGAMLKNNILRERSIFNQIIDGRAYQSVTANSTDGIDSVSVDALGGGVNRSMGGFALDVELGALGSAGEGLVGDNIIGRGDVGDNTIGRGGIVGRGEAEYSSVGMARTDADFSMTEGLWTQQQIQLSGHFEIKIQCKLFNTYILVEYRNDVYLIDQHAAHERIIFDKLLSSYDSDSLAVQPLLLPYIFDLPHGERLFLEESIDLLAKMGFEIDKLSGNSYSLSAVPYSCININCCDFIRYFLENIGKNTLKQSDIVSEKVARAACKAAVKGNDDLSIDEINKLLGQLLTTEKLFCPHGRPIIVKITKTEIEKWFKRIV